MKRLIMIVAVMILAGCGEDGKLIERHHVPQEVIDQIAGEPGKYGYARWKNSEPYDECDVYLLPKREYVETEIYTWDEDCQCYVRVTYKYAFGHEAQHCFEKHYHD